MPNATNRARRASRKGSGKPPPPPSPSLSLFVQCEGVELPVDRARVRRWVAASLESDAELTIRLVGNAEARRLNRDFRDRDYPTNVLTFAYGGAPAIQADIVICMPVASREARTQHRSIEAHLAHLVVHGVLHAQGYDHETDADAARMESREVEILRRFRVDNPYSF